MTRFITKFVLVGAVAALAIAMSVAPSDAAKRRAAAKSASCLGPAFCSTNCQGGICAVNLCGTDGKWYPAILTPICLEGLCVNRQKKC